MNKIFSSTAIVTTLIGTGIASSLLALPVLARETNLVDSSNKAELISQNFDYRDRSYSSQSTDSIKNIIGVTGLVIGTGAIAYQLSKANKPSLANSLPILNRENASLFERINPKLRRELLRLVHNRQTADRLLSSTLVRHTGRSPNWVAEKVIYDLKRDRL